MIDEKNFTIRDLSSTIFPERSGSGFTLVELIIVISLIAILSVVGIAAFASYSRAQALNAAAGDLAVMLNLAKLRAYSQIKPSTVASCATSPLDGYEVRICGSRIPSTSCVTTTIGVDYELDVRCGGSVRSPSISTATFPNLTFTPSALPAVYSFFFPVLKGSVVGNGTVSVSNTYNESKTVTVDTSGNIRVER